jgi:hypothetical protein
MSDALSLLKYLRDRENGLLDTESIRKMNLNGSDVLPDGATMELVPREYRRKYNEDIFK